MSNGSATRKEWIVHRTLCWIRAWIEIACSIISILTLTFYRPWWDMSFINKTSKILVRMRSKIEKSGLNAKGRPITCKIDNLEDIQ